MRIEVTSVLVDDQEKALTFYTERLGFVRKVDIPLGEFRWLTVVSSEKPEGTELLLEPDANPAAKDYKKALYEQKIPLVAFAVDDARAQYHRLSDLGVQFSAEPVEMDDVIIAVLDDTCGNWVQLYQEL